ncbi:hypothetical protein GCM10018773_45390 [Streptomyces candidus]|nr:hypothetical protein GCM10018773_45390 [Streptomyces candidus]
MPDFAAADGTRLAYRLVGEGEPLICLPGSTRGGGTDLGELGSLSAHRQLVLLGPRSAGVPETPVDPVDCHCRRQVAEVEALRAHLGLERVDVLAHTADGNLALRYAAAHPRHIRSLALIVPTAREADLPVEDGELIAAAGLSRGGPRSEEAAYEARSVARTPAPHGQRDESAHADVASGLVSGRATTSTGCPGTDPLDVRDALAWLDAPVLVLAGEPDGASAGAAGVAALFPRGEVAVRAGGGHLRALDDPGGFTRTVAAFLDPEVHGVRLPDGTRLAYRTWGDPAAPPVVLLHGRGGSSTDWAHIAEILAASRRVYAPDLRGHGLSDWSGGYGYARLARDVLQFLDALGIHRVDLVGHSMGGGAAYQAAQVQPGRVTRLVLEDPPPPFPLNPPRLPQERPAPEELRVFRFDWDLIPPTDEDLNHPDPAWAARLCAITAPTLVLSGGPTSFVSEQDLRRLAQLVPVGRLVTIPVGHLIHQDAPDRFLAALRTFGIP